MNIISFPGLGLEFNINPQAFAIGGLSVKWYGLILSTGIVLAFFYFYFRATRTERISSDDVYNVTLFCVPIAVIGARAMYVLTTLDSGNYKSFIDVIAIWKGGIAIYGAVIAGGITVFVYSRIKRLKPLRVLDAIAPAVMLGQLIGRWGNFANGECFGSSAGVENLPWRMVVTKGMIVNDGLGVDFVHPTFLYESLWNLVGFLIINLVLYRKKKFDGQIFFAYAIWYGLGRGFIEMLRTDSLFIPGTGIKISVLIGFVTCIAGIVLYIIMLNKSNRVQADSAAYVPKFSGLAMQTTPDGEPISAPADEQASVEDSQSGEPEGETEGETEPDKQSDAGESDNDKGGE